MGLDRLDLGFLKQKAKQEYVKAQIPDYLDCGRQMAEYLKPEIAIARRTFSRYWKQIKKRDPKAPDDPFEDYNNKEGGSDEPIQ